MGLGTLGSVIFFLVLLGLYAQAHPVDDKDTDDSCIAMTPERADEIRKIGEEFNNFIQDLTDKYEDIDFTLVEVTIENHSDDEEEEKETMLKIIVNDCKDNDKKYNIKEERYFESDHLYHDHSTTNTSVSTNDNTNENKTPNKSVDENSENKTYDDTDAKETNYNDGSSENESQDDYNEIESDESSENKIKNENTAIAEESTHDNVNNTITDPTELDDSSNNTKRTDENTAKNTKETKLISKNAESNDDSIKDNDNDSRNQQNEKVDTKINKNYNYNGDYDRSNVFIYAPKIDNWNIETGDNYDRYTNQLREDLKKLLNNNDKSNKNVKKSFNYVTDLLKLYKRFPIFNV